MMKATVKFDTELPAGAYVVTATGWNLLSRLKELEVVAPQEVPLTIELLKSLVELKASQVLEHQAAEKKKSDGGVMTATWKISKFKFKGGPLDLAAELKPGEYELTCEQEVRPPPPLEPV